MELTPELIGARFDGMAELPRTVFLLRHVDGLEVAAIGARLGLLAEDVEQAPGARAAGADLGRLADPQLISCPLVYCLSYRLRLLWNWKPPANLGPFAPVSR
ncbi:hypothetical protein NDN01_02690 [Sphingomonas sp. QA11]|uniref:hypothetical protein n=1 Tax=Sphingomonas sp. QA11 TaxID=2950605 RepID=UPI00234ABCE5|nr:hypothetical protein [Sphingomonas sp. QA11]WCM27856.1 hypothetical protein NDN01_02690 [Sphingomonas sp. QA11]